MEHLTPSKSIFNEMKIIAVRIWNSNDLHPSYLEEKMKPVNNRVNFKDNAMVFYREFDMINQATFRSYASREVIEYINNNP